MEDLSRFLKQTLLLTQRCPDCGGPVDIIEHVSIGKLQISCNNYPREIQKEIDNISEIKNPLSVNEESLNRDQIIDHLFNNLVLSYPGSLRSACIYSVFIDPSKILSVTNTV